MLTKTLTGSGFHGILTTAEKVTIVCKIRNASHPGRQIGISFPAMPDFFNAVLDLLKSASAKGFRKSPGNNGNKLSSNDR